MLCGFLQVLKREELGFSHHDAQQCAGKYFITALGGAMGETLICSNGVNTPTISGVKLPMWYPWTQSWEEMPSGTLLYSFPAIQVW